MLNENLYTWTENFKGGINNLWVAKCGVYGVAATSEISKEQAIRNLKRKINNNN